MRLKFLVILVLLTAIGIVLGGQMIAAQTGTEAVTCPDLIERVLLELEENCTGLGRNSACYGYTRVAATFNREVEEEYFSRPADRTEIVFLESLSTAPLSLDSEEWGVALMNIQANLPGTLPGQSVTFILFGDATVVNAVPEDEAALPFPPIALQTRAQTGLRTAAGANTNFVTTVPAGAALEGDAISPDRGWVRVVYETLGGWVRVEDLEPADLSVLPVVSRETRTPMQSFLFRTGIGQPECAEAPDSVVIQGPQNLEVSLNVNGADINIGSTVRIASVLGAPSDILDALDLPEEVRERLLSSEDDLLRLGAEQVCAVMQLSVVNGAVTLNDGRFTLPEGNHAFSVFCGDASEFGGLLSDDPLALLDPTNFRITFASPWGAFRMMTQEELEQLRFLEQVTLNVLNYPIVLPDYRSIRPVQTSTPTPGPVQQLGIFPTNTPGLTIEATPEPPPQDVQTGPTPLPGAGVPAGVGAVVGGGQTVTVGQPVAVPFSVQVLDAYGSPVAGAPITFSAPASGPSGTFGATGSTNETVITDANGNAVTSGFTSNNIAGTYFVTVYSGGGAAQQFKGTTYSRRAVELLSPAAQPAVLTLIEVTNVADVPVRVAAVSGDGQSTPIQTQFASPLVAQVQDQFGNGVAGVTVTFITTYGSSIPGALFIPSELQIASGVSGPDGTVTSPLLVANEFVGTHFVLATGEGLSEATIFTLTNTAGPPAFIDAIEGVEQVTTVSFPFPEPLVVIVQDSFGNPAAGVPVTFRPSEDDFYSSTLSGEPQTEFSLAGGTFDGQPSVTVLTDAEGIAQAQLTANTVSGFFTIEAVAPGVEEPALFFLYNAPGSPYAIERQSSSPVSAPLNTFFSTLMVRVTDFFGNGVTSVPVQFTIDPGTTGAFFDPDGLTRTVFTSDGLAMVFNLFSGPTAGNFTVTATTSGLPPVVFDMTVLNPTPILSSLLPNAVDQGASGFTLSIYGTGFVGSSIVTWSGQPNLTPSFVISGQVDVNVPSSYVASSGSAQVAVVNPGPGGGTSNALTFTINPPPPNPPAEVTGLTPNSAVVGDAGFTLTIDGNNFLPGAVVTWETQSDLTPSSINSTQILVDIPASYIAVPGEFAVGVSNPLPGGGSANTLTFTVAPAPPVVSGVVPSDVTASDTPVDVSITVTGSGFAADAVVQIDPGIDLVTTYDSDTQLTAVMPAELLECEDIGSSYIVRVRNVADATISTTFAEVTVSDLGDCS